MATPISKRQQARNERQLQDLIQTVPGNDRCADCAAKNPGWASWSLGIFLCVRCASLHRKLGTHVSKVKSLSMDAWSAEQVENMKKMGNVRSNAMYNPQNTKADIPIDADEVDGAVERFIRQKYESKSLSLNKLAARRNTGSTSTGSWSDEPPPLPPKPKKFPFSFRSASATPQRSKQDRLTPPMSPVSPEGDRGATEGGKVPLSKPSQVFGMKITGVGNNFDQKLTMMRDMGFGDNRKNSEILKSSNGNLDKAVETLVRLGEGSNPVSSGPTPAPRSLTPISMASAGVSGISIDKTRPSDTKVSNNPWDIRAASPQRSVSQPAPAASPLPRSQSAGPPSNSWNPFFNQQQDPSVQQLGNTFQALQVSQTGPGQQQQQQQYLAQQIPSVPQIPQQYQTQAFQPQQVQSNPWHFQQSQPLQQPVGTASPFSQPQPSQQPPPGPLYHSQQSNQFNPFMGSQSALPSNPWAMQTSSPVAISQQPSPWTSQTQSPAPTAQPASNPFMPSVTGTPWSQPQQMSGSLQPTGTDSPAPMTGQPNYFLQQQPHQASFEQRQPIQTFNHNPWQQQTVTPQQQQYPQPVQAGHHPAAQPTPYDKNSILALYNMPNLAPRQPLQSLQENPNAAQQYAPTQRSVTMPVQTAANTNAFMAPSTQPIRHVSNESVDFVNLGGRHSPDAFAGLSAQYMR